MQLLDDDLAPVTISVINPVAREIGDAGEQGSPGIIRITRGGDLSGSLTVGMVFKFDAPNPAYPTIYAIGNDYEFDYRVGPNLGDVSVEFDMNESTIDFTVTPLGDSEVEGDEVIELELYDYENNGFGYKAIGEKFISLTVIDDDSDRVEVDVEEPAPGTLFDAGDGISLDLASGNAAISLGNGLTYSTGNGSKPIFGISYFPIGSGSLPGTIEAKIKVNGTQLASAFFTTSGISSGQGARFSMQVDTSSLGAGAYSYSVEVRGHYSPSNIFQQTVNGNRHILYADTSPAPVGGWGFSNMSRLIVHSSGAYVKNTDGTYQGFRVRSGVYTPTEGHYNSLTVDSVTDYGTVRDPYGNRDVYDAQGTLVRRIDRNNNTTTYTYVDANGDGKAWELSTTTDPFGRITTYTYSGGRLSTVTDFAIRTTTYQYTSVGRLQYVIEPDPDGPGPQTPRVTTITYDGNGRLTSTATPGNYLRTVSYDFAGRVEYVSSTVTTTSGRTISLHPVQTRGLLEPGTGEGTPGNPADVVTADRIATLADPFNRLTTLHLDRKGRVLREIDPLGNITDYKRDIVGNVWQVMRPDPDGTGPLQPPITKYGYDGKGNLLKSSTLIQQVNRGPTTQASASQPLTLIHWGVSLFSLSMLATATQQRRPIRQVEPLPILTLAGEGCKASLYLIPTVLGH